MHTYGNLVTKDFGTARSTDMFAISTNIASAAKFISPASPLSSLNVVLGDMLLSVATDMVVTLKEETTGSAVGAPIHMAAKIPLQFTPRYFFEVPTVGKRLMIQGSTSGLASVTTLTFQR